MTSSPEVDPPKPKQRPIIRLVIFIIAHSFLFCIACTVAGVVALLLLPVLANKTYVSENALMP
nr:glycosylphosphatidylinositol anchor attachment 1 protein [Tanacetum cinerariifolium]